MTFIQGVNIKAEDDGKDRQRSLSLSKLALTNISNNQAE